MKYSVENVKEAILRIIVVSVIAIGSGYLFFGSAVFNPRMTWFEFVANGVTIAIAYSAFKSSQIRDGFALLFLWYLFLNVFVFLPHNDWMPRMEASYVIGLTASVYVYFLLARKSVISGWVQRIIVICLLIGFAHGLIVLFLEVLTQRLFIHPSETVGWSFMNLKTGLVIGIVCAVGMELSEYLIASKFLSRSVSE